MARQSGTAAESKTIRNAANAAEQKTTGSWVETPKTRLFSHRDAPQLPASRELTQSRLTSRFAFPYDEAADGPRSHCDTNGDLLPSAAYPVVEHPISLMAARMTAIPAKRTSRIVVKRRWASVELSHISAVFND